MSGDIQIRDYEPEDVKFIYDSWFKSWRGCKNAGVIPNNMYYEVMRTVLENLIGRGADIKIAVAHGRILGYICYEWTADKQPVVHYIYVKDPYFSFGVGELLRQEAFKGHLKPGFITFKSPIVLKYFADYKWAPEIARRKEA